MAKKKIDYKYNFVLLIDDNDLDNFINQKIIESANFAKTIFVNTNSISALEFLKNLSLLPLDNGHSHFPEIIFVDINMPIMDGFQFVSTLIKNMPDIFEKSKLVILTTSLNPADKRTAFDISDKIIFLNKPLNALLLEQI